VSAGRAPDPRAALVSVPRVLLGSSVAILAIGAFVHSRGVEASPELEIVAWMALGWAALAPIVAVVVRGQGLVAPSPVAGETRDALLSRLQRTIVFFGVLESAVVLAAAALVVSTPAWPLGAALLPLAVMAINLPQRTG
jgi:hypothetical protein